MKAAYSQFYTSGADLLTIKSVYVSAIVPIRNRNRLLFITSFINYKSAKGPGKNVQ